MLEGTHANCYALFFSDSFNYFGSPNFFQSLTVVGEHLYFGSLQLPAIAMRGIIFCVQNRISISLELVLRGGGGGEMVVLSFVHNCSFNCLYTQLLGPFFKLSQLN